MKRLFGTDGIRGVAGRSPLRSSDAFRLGWAAGQVLKDHFRQLPIRVLIVRDTRASGEELVHQLSSGLQAQGIDVCDVGVLCTPSVAYLVQAHRFQSGIVVSASHNPPEFNGIKFFTKEGRKWPDRWEEAVEDLYFSKTKAKKSKKESDKGHRLRCEELAYDYESFLRGTLPSDLDLSSFKIAVDCSNGANFKVAPHLFKSLGANVITLGTKPNGKNINIGCGSQSTKSLATVVKQKKCNFGVAFDGDGDRVIFVDEKGQTVDGDFIIALLAKYFKSKRRLKNNKAVITVMANLGLKKALAKMGIKPVETPVGDRYVSEAMRRHQSILGGEQSGHIILGKYLPSGDGLLTALHVAAIVKESRQSFSKLVQFMKKFPQVLVNVRVAEKVPIQNLNGVQSKIQQIENKLGDQGRVLVRYSGTEPLLRIMIEGPKETTIQRFASELVTEVQSALA